MIHRDISDHVCRPSGTILEAKRKYLRTPMQIVVQRHCEFIDC